MFNSIDKKFEKIGFEKIEEDEYGAVYERYDEEYSFTHVISILRKQNGQHIVQSYDKNLIDEDCIGNTCVGLTY